MFAPPPGFTIPLTAAVPPKPGTFTHTRFGASFEAYEYSGWIDESMSWKTACYIGDWSPLGKLRVTGPEALKFFSDISVNSFAKFEVGQAKHVVFCNGDGKVMGEGILMRLAAEEFLFTSGPGILWADHMFRKGNYAATAEQVGPDGFILQLQGPNALSVLEKATRESLRDIGFMRFRQTQIGNRQFLALRKGMSGDIGYELHGSIEHAVEIYGALLEVGREFGIRQLGGRTKMVNHVEACFPTPTVDYIPAMFGEAERDFLENTVKVKAANFLNLVRHKGSYPVDDISALYRSPIELGWAKNIKLDHAFVGYAALERELAAPKRKMMTLVWDDDDVIDVYASLFRAGQPHDFMEMPRELLGCMQCDRVEKDDRIVGATSSRCYSYFMRKMLSLCVLDVAHCVPGEQVTVIWGSDSAAQKRIRATVAPAPIKPDKRRVDVTKLSLAVA
jgi:glycine cleavage system aminomethyltransferase T